MGIQSVLIFGDNFPFLKDMGYFLKKIMGYGILGPPFQGLIKKPRRKVYLYQKGDNESMRSETLRFAKEMYFN